MLHDIIHLIRKPITIICCAKSCSFRSFTISHLQRSFLFQNFEVIEEEEEKSSSTNMLFARTSILAIALFTASIMSAAIPRPSNGMSHRSYLREFDLTHQTGNVNKRSPFPPLPANIDADALNASFANPPTDEALDRQANDLEFIGFGDCRAEGGVVQCSDK